MMLLIPYDLIAPETLLLAAQPIPQTFPPHPEHFRERKNRILMGGWRRSHFEKRSCKEPCGFLLIAA